jgi:transcriptional regulator with PAS, ATPase and Fis domain
VSSRKGLLKLADGGTIFLDEISELPLSLQLKLLRAMHEKSFIPPGGKRRVKFNVRVIAGSQGNLLKALKQGRFRTDLFYWLSVLVTTLPPRPWAEVLFSLARRVFRISDSLLGIRGL